MPAYRWLSSPATSPTRDWSADVAGFTCAVDLADPDTPTRVIATVTNNGPDVGWYSLKFTILDSSNAIIATGAASTKPIKPGQSYKINDLWNLDGGQERVRAASITTCQLQFVDRQSGTY
jgi:hypothetical protein